MGVNPVPDNILSRRGGSVREPPVPPSLSSRMRGPIPPSVVPAQSLPPLKTGAATHPHYPHLMPSGAESKNLAALPLVVLAHAGTHPSLSVFPRAEPAPVKTGAATHPHHLTLSSRMRGPIPPSPDVITMKIARSAATNPFPLDGGRLEPALVKTGDGGEPRARQHSLP